MTGTRSSKGSTVAEFLDSFDVDREALLRTVRHFEDVWGRFQERRALDVEGDDVNDSLIAQELSLVRDELETKKFTVGMFGLIKRGKSTLLNGLIGREVSSMHVTPETAVPVYVDYGETSEAAVYFSDGRIKHVSVEEVEQFTSQKFNENNQLGVTHVYQRVPVSFLRHGTRLIDTPGLDDAAADEVYTERTLQELDAADAGIVVFLSPPTVGATEMRFLEQIASRQLSKTFLVCNMYPQHFYDEETRNQVLQYVGRRILESTKQLGAAAGELKIYPVCALDAWEARRNGDIDQFKRSGVARLLRDLETYLSKDAGRHVLRAAGERVAHAAELAQNEVAVRQRLLADPAALSQHRMQVDGHIRALERDYDRTVSAVLTQTEPLKNKVMALVNQPFARARTHVERCESASELEQFVQKFRREVTVSSEMAARKFHDGFGHVTTALRRKLEEEFEAVMGDLHPDMNSIQLSNKSMMAMQVDTLTAARAQEDRKMTTSLAAAGGGGLTAGGAAMVAGMTVLGPVGLIAGGLIGWKMASTLGPGRSLAKAKAEVIERLNEVCDSLISDLDAQISATVEALKASVHQRRKMFAKDLYAQFDLVESLSNDPTRLEAYRRDSERFVVAFSQCIDAVNEVIESAGS